MEDRIMWDVGWMSAGMTDGGIAWWHWFFTIHGILALFFLVVTIVATIALIRDWRRNRRNGAGIPPIRARRRSGSVTREKEENRERHAARHLPSAH